MIICDLIESHTANIVSILTDEHLLDSLLGPFGVRKIDLQIKYAVFMLRVVVANITTDNVGQIELNK